jgi:uncharacterized integral membrane protein
MKVLSWLISVPFAVIVILFAISNFETVTLNVWPVPFAVDAPLYLVVLVSVLFGVLWGGVAAWISGGKARARMRMAEMKAEQTARENRRLAQALETKTRAETPASGGEKLPAVSSARPAA